jgi:hypothetical protein
MQFYVFCILQKNFHRHSSNRNFSSLKLKSPRFNDNLTAAVEAGSFYAENYNENVDPWHDVFLLASTTSFNNLCTKAPITF